MYKRFFFFIGILIFSLNNILFFYANTNEKNLSISIESGYYNDDENGYILNYEVLKSNSSITYATVICAIYDSNNKLITETSEKVNFQENDVNIHKRIKLDISEIKCKDASIKLFLWNDINSMLPITNTVFAKISDVPTTEKNVNYDFGKSIFTSLGRINEPTTIDGLTFIGNSDGKSLSVRESDGTVYFYGGGTNADCSLMFNVKKSCKLSFIVKGTDTETRYLKIGDDTKTIQNLEITPGEINILSYKYTGDAKNLYIASKSSGLFLYQINILYDYDDYDSYENMAEKNYYVKNFEELKTALRSSNLYGGGNIFVQSDLIECSNELVLSEKNKNITICGDKNYKAIFDFSAYANLFDEKEQVSHHGIFITGSGYTIKNIIVQNAPGRGISLHKGNSFNNVIENVISRYNANGGIGIYQGAYNNTIKNCYAYRNCDILTMGENADGMQAAIGAGKGNKFINCFSWENADDGFDFFAMYEDLYLENCATWNNGNPDVFTGKCDFDKGKPLDENLHLVQLFEKNDPTFKTNYENNIFKLPEGDFITVSEDKVNFDIISPEAFSTVNWSGNPNGFKLGSGDSKHGPQVTGDTVRYMKNCISFDNPAKGFDKNGSICTINIENAFSFKNGGYNYLLNDCTVSKFKNVFAPISGKNKFPTNYSAQFVYSNKRENAENAVYELVDKIEAMVYNDIIPSGIYLDYIFDILKN